MAQRRQLLVGLAMAVVATLASCGKAPEGTGAGSPADAGTDDPGKIELGFRVKEGETYKFRLVFDQVIAQAAGGAPVQETPRTTGFDLSHVVAEVRDDGTAVLEVTFDALRYKEKGLLGTVDYDSSSSPPAELPEGIVQGLVTLVGKGYSVEVSPTGKVANVQGADALVAAVKEAIEIPNPLLKPVVEAQLSQQFGAGAMKAMVEQMIGAYPEGPVGPGDSWEKDSSVSQGIAVVIHDTWTLASRAGGVAVLKLESTVQSDPNAPGLNTGIATVKYDLSGTRNGSVELEEATGWVKKSTIHQSLSGELKVGSGAQDMGEIPVPLSIEGTTTIERL